MKTLSTQNLRQVAEEFVHTSEFGMERFTKNFTENPLDCLRFNNQVALYAGRHWVGKTVLAWLDREVRKEEDADPMARSNAIMKELVDIYRREARYPTHSTDPISNEADRMKAAAAAEFAERFGR